MRMMPLLLAIGLAAIQAGPVLAVTDKKPPVKQVERLSDQAAQDLHFKALGFKKRGGIDKDTTDRDEAVGQGFPHFASSFSVGGNNYPFTMVGYRPQSGRTATIHTVIIPLRMNFNAFGVNFDISKSFDPAAAVANMVNSPLYRPANYPSGYGQFGDQMQRATFWNRMDAGHNWHVLMATPAVAPTVDIYVTPETGSLSHDAAGNTFGNVLIDFMDSQARTILQLMDLDSDVVPIFVTSGVTAEALGYHTAYPVGTKNGSSKLQTYVYTSWLDPTQVSPLFADVSTFNHELAEWLNDPFVNNIVPNWAYPPASDPAASCSGNPYLEVGDPQGNGPTFRDFPTVPVTLGGVTYHLQQLVLWQWFADEVPSSAYGGWYTFPAPNSLKQPAFYCN